jgi:hypothetical protein
MPLGIQGVKVTFYPCGVQASFIIAVLEHGIWQGTKVAMGYAPKVAAKGMIWSN